jgi:hypothetical protein
MFMLPPDDIALGQVTYVGNAWLAAGFYHHPAHVGPAETAVCVIRIEVGICISVMCTVATGPPLDGTLDCACTSHSKDVL